MSTLCPHCGFRFEERTQFCPNCREVLGTVSAPAAPSADGQPGVDVATESVELDVDDRPAFRWADVALLLGFFGGIPAAVLALATETTWWKVALAAALGAQFVLGVAGNWRYFKKHS